MSRLNKFSVPAITLLAAVCLTPATGDGFLATRAAAQNTQRQPSPVEKLFTEAERLFQAGKLEAAVKKYDELITKHANDIPNEAAYALFHLRLAACYQGIAAKVPTDKEEGREKAQKILAAAEKELLLFLDKKKYPKGTDTLLDNSDNYRVRAQISLADVYSKEKKWEDAIKLLQTILQRANMEATEENRTHATTMLTRVLEGQASEKNSATKKKVLEYCLTLLEPRIASKDFRKPEIKDAASRVVEIHTKLGRTKEAKMLNEEINAAMSGSPLDRVMANFRRLDIGDSLFAQAENLGEQDIEQKQRIYRQALTTYQETLRSAAVSQLLDGAIKIQEERVLKTRQANSAESKDEAVKQAQRDAIEKAERERDAFMGAVDAFRKNKDYDAFISYRIALCLLELKRPWEAYIAFRDIFDNAPKFSKMDIAHYFYIRALRDIHRNKEAIEACKEFLKKYPGKDQVGEVAVQSGEILFESEDYEAAIKQFRWARDNVKSLTVEYKEWIDWYICVSLFRFVEWKACLNEVTAFLGHYPKSKQKEQMLYMRGLCCFYQGDYKNTITALNEYLSAYPNGNFRPDARYRLAIVKFGLNPPNNAGTLADAEAWLRDYQSPPPALAADIARQRPEVLTLIGDVYFRYADDRKLPDEKRQDSLKKAIKFYIDAAKSAKNNEYTFDHVVRELNRRLPSQGEWGKLLDAHITFYDWNPDGPKALDHLYWILRAVEKMGKTVAERRAEATKEGIKVPEKYLAQKPEQILADAILRNINDRKKENVEQLITELASRVIRKSRLAIRRAQTAQNAKKAIEKARQDVVKAEENNAKAVAAKNADDSDDNVNWVKKSAIALQKARDDLKAYIEAAEKARQVADEAANEYKEPIRSELKTLDLEDKQKINSLVARIADDFMQETLKLGDASIHKELVAQARGHFARAEIARLCATRKELLAGMPKGYSDNIAKIPRIYKPEELSPALLAVATDFLVESAQKLATATPKKSDAEIKAAYAKADEFAQYILDHHRDSANYADYGFLAKAIVLLEDQKDAKEANAVLKEANDFDVIYTKEKDIRLTQARALIEIGTKPELDEAEKILKGIGANKAWRGEATAWSLYYLGQVEEKRGISHTNEAINYYRRCFLAWKKFGNVTAKCYSRVIALFQRKGDRNGVGGTIWDMLQTDNPASLQPEAEEARKLRAAYPYTPPPPPSSTPAVITPSATTAAVPAAAK